VRSAKDGRRDSKGSVSYRNSSERRQEEGVVWLKCEQHRNDKGQVMRCASKVGLGTCHGKKGKMRAVPAFRGRIRVLAKKLEGTEGTKRRREKTMQGDGCRRSCVFDQDSFDSFQVATVVSHQAQPGVVTRLKLVSSCLHRPAGGASSSPQSPRPHLTVAHTVQ